MLPTSKWIKKLQAQHDSVTWPVVVQFCVLYCTMWQFQLQRKSLACSTIIRIFNSKDKGLVAHNSQVGSPLFHTSIGSESQWLLVSLSLRTTMSFCTVKFEIMVMINLANLSLLFRHEMAGDKDHQKVGPWPELCLQSPSKEWLRRFNRPEGPVLKQDGPTLTFGHVNITFNKSILSRSGTDG